MRILITGKNAKNIEPMAKKLGFEIVTAKPDVIISYGGDGTLLSSEREYPGIPKLPIRDSQFCKKCPDHDDRTLLQALAQNKLKLQEFKKLHTQIGGQDLFALNDFVIRNEQTIHAIRFNVFVDEIQQGGLLIGDGIVIATPFGSTGYFKSVTGQTFKKGWGLTFNNTTKKIPPVFFKDEDIVTFKLVRGNATLSFDNNPDILSVDEESEITFKLSDQTAKIYELETLRCANCQVQR